jgi:hypothetical protein
MGASQIVSTLVINDKVFGESRPSQQSRGILKMQQRTPATAQTTIP